MVVADEEADALAARLLGDLRTKLGGLHIEHARRVAAAVADQGDGRLVAGALLHDVIEKSLVDADQLRSLTGDPELVTLVEVLTHRAGEIYDVYLARCAADARALRIKRADLVDKLVATDATVPDDVAERLRRLATARLALLDRLAKDTIVE